MRLGKTMKFPLLKRNKNNNNNSNNNNNNNDRSNSSDSSNHIDDDKVDDLGDDSCAEDCNQQSFNTSIGDMSVQQGPSSRRPDSLEGSHSRRSSKGGDGTKLVVRRGSIQRQQSNDVLNKIKDLSNYKNNATTTTTTTLTTVSNNSATNMIKDDYDGWSAGSPFTTATSAAVSHRTSVVHRIALRLCLRPAFGLRTQVFLSFGGVSIVSIVFVWIISIITTREAGNDIVKSGLSATEIYYQGRFGLLTGYMADAIQQEQWIATDGLLSILTETTKDRLRGYPGGGTGYSNDSSTPFENTNNNNNNNNDDNHYPWAHSHIIPSPEELIIDNGDTILLEHLGASRMGWYGNSDLSLTDPVFVGPPCNEDNHINNNNNSSSSSSSSNDCSTTTEQLRSRLSDYAPPVMKALYEYHTNIHSIGIYLSNHGHGATVRYPGQRLKDTNLSSSSLQQQQQQQQKDGGCDWLNQPQPERARAIGDETMVPNCQYSTQQFNPLQTSWCREQALHPNEMRITGPHLDSLSNTTVLTYGRSVFDDLTQELIGCVAVHIPIDHISTMVARYRQLGSVQTVALVTSSSDNENDSDSDKDGIVLGGAPRPPVTDGTVDDFPAINLTASMVNKMKQDLMRRYHTDKRLSDYVVFVDPYFRAISPIPFPPNDRYDPSYQPQLLLIQSIDVAISGDAEVAGLQKAADEEVERVMNDIIVSCSVSIGIMALLLYVMTICMTIPLKWIARTGNKVLQSFGTGTTIHTTSTPWFHRFAPRTEITLLMEQFQIMMTQFSGRGTAKIFKRQLLEIKNPFGLHLNFTELYEESQANSNNSGSYYWSLDNQGDNDMLGDDSTTIPSEQALKSSELRKHWGPNVHADGNASHSYVMSTNSFGQATYTFERSQLFRSRLFWWMLCTLSLPLLCVLAGVSAYVVWTIRNSFPALTDSVRSIYVGFERFGLTPTNQIRAWYVQDIMRTSLRDLFVFTRVASWFYLGALPTNNATSVAMTTNAEACKNYDKDCPFVSKTCDCAWRDPWRQDACQSDFGPGQSRPLQQVFFEGLNQDVLMPSGDRINTTYPETASDPSSTSFYPNRSAVPGGNGPTTKYETTHDRLEILSALSVIQIPLYNYANNAHYFEEYRGVQIGFEADGMLGGYTGCRDTHAYAAHFQSTEQNRASVLQPELCPPGKYGFDARCTDWYTNGKASGTEFSSLYVTLPVALNASNDQFGVEASLPLIDTQSQEHIGQSKIDISLDRIRYELGPEGTSPGEGGESFLVSIRSDYDGSDTIIAPGFDLATDKRAAFQDLMLPYDEPCDNIFEYSKSCETRSAFQKGLIALKSGDVGRVEFNRSDAEGDTDDFHIVTYHPINVSVLQPIDASNFSRGVERIETTVFSMGFIQADRLLVEGFEDFGGDVDNTAKLALGVLIGTIAASCLLAVYVSAQVAVSITIPITQLLTLVRKINRYEVQDDFPEIQGGSNEVRQVRLTFERLFMLIRFATAAFFSGEISRAYTMLNEALDLFKKLGNDKAIGIANNNLGNTMLTIYRTMKKTGAPTICNMTMNTVIERGEEYFKKTIDAGESAIERINKEEGFSVNYLIFMQQLSNRYFNRAVFLLTVRDDHSDPNQAESQGLIDLSTSKDMDREVVDNGDKEGFKGEKDVHFELLLSRIKGLLLLMRLGYEDEWGLEDLFDDARKELNSAIQQPGHTLFRDMEPAGQMQRLDYALIDYYRLLAERSEDDKESADAKHKAACVAIRMLVEDDFLIGEAAMLSLKAVIDDLETMTDLGGADKSDLKSELFGYRHHIGEALSLQYSKNDMIAREAFLLSNMGDVSMECF